MSFLIARDLTIFFGGLAAVEDVSFEVCEGEIFSMIGPNGAGKTTVFNMVTGIYKPTRGTIDFNGRGLAGLRPHSITEMGIARTFQTIRLFPALSASVNVMAGQHCRTRSGMWDAIAHSARQKREEAAIRQRTEYYLRLMGLYDQRDELARNLPYGSQRRLEIARALATEPRLLMLDEPAAGLNDQESAELMATIRQIRERGITIFLIEHDMKVVMGISDRIVVLENGHKIAEGSPAQVKADERVVEAYLGKDTE